MAHEEGIIDMDVGDAVELKALEEGEYNLLCRNAEIGAGDSGPYILLRLEAPDEMESKGITHVMMLPQEDDDPKQQNRRKLAIKRAAEAFGVDYTPPWNVNDFVNEEASAYLTVEEDEDYGRQNRVRRWTTGPEESGSNRAEDLALE